MVWSVPVVVAWCGQCLSASGRCMVWSVPVVVAWCGQCQWSLPGVAGASASVLLAARDGRGVLLAQDLHQPLAHEVRPLRRPVVLLQVLHWGQHTVITHSDNTQ